MKQRLFLLISLCFLWTTLCYAEVDAIEVVQSNGSISTFMLEKKPKTTYDGTVLLISTVDESVQIEMEGDVKVSFVDSGSAGIETIKDNAPQVKVTVDAIIANGLNPHSVVEIFSLAGSLIYSSKVNEDGSVYLPLNESGHYIIKSSNLCFKIKK